MTNPPVLAQELVRALRQQEVVRNPGDLLRFFPRALQQPQLALQSAAFLLFVEGHLNGEPGGLGHLVDVPGHALLVLVGVPPGQVHQEALGMSARFDLVDRELHGILLAARGVDPGQDGAGESASLLAIVPGRLLSLSDLDSEAVLVVGGPDACAEQILVLEPDHLAAFGVQFDQGALMCPQMHDVAALAEHYAAQDAGGQSPDHDTPDHHRGTRPVQDLPLSSPPELVTVAPRRELGAHGLADPHERQPFGVPRQADVVGRNANPRVPEDALAVLDRLPALLQRRQVPAFAFPADHPEAPPGGIEGEPAADGEGLDDLVGSQGFPAEHAGFVHGDQACPDREAPKGSKGVISATRHPSFAPPSDRRYTAPALQPGPPRQGSSDPRSPGRPPGTALRPEPHRPRPR